MFRDCCESQEASKTVPQAWIGQMRNVSLCPSIFLPRRVVFCKTSASMKSGSVLPSPVPVSAPLLFPLYCQGQIESKDTVSQDVVRQVNKLYFFPEGKISLHGPIFPVPFLICSLTVYPVLAEESFL